MSIAKGAYESVPKIGFVAVVYFIALGILLLILIGIVKVASGRHYEDMTEEEFEAEAKRASSMGAAVGRLQEIIDPAHSAEHITEQQQRIEADRTNSGDRPAAQPQRGETAQEK